MGMGPAGQARPGKPRPPAQARESGSSRKVRGSLMLWALLKLLLRIRDMWNPSAFAFRTKLRQKVSPFPRLTWRRSPAVLGWGMSEMMALRGLGTEDSVSSSYGRKCKISFFFSFNLI